ncbi:disintegrin and metalloproteinase domain-containing protein 15 isoform X2 [Xenopus laevis]|uniref:Disintegrin and metalloproteinase domain-containing protein 15 isoform X2 n=1 Tax=Xenopus laevis TaxID=8355 RepID=A0A8J1LM31_XENLA|nr:disintegrin and metalloproteinase domain-containing protein 15 isoform X2 [Xenopus laevis]
MRLGLFRLLQLLLSGLGICGLDRVQPDGILSWEVTPELHRRGHRLSLQDVMRTLPSDLHMSMEIDGNQVELDLEWNRHLLPESHSLTYYLPNGSHVTQRDPRVENCYYHGQLEGQTGPWSSISLCSGIRGIILTSPERGYSIEPLPGDPPHKHIVRLTPGNSRNSTCGSTEAPQSLKLSPHHRIKRDVVTEAKYVELVLVADNTEYKMFSGDMKSLHLRILEIANKVDAFYRPLNVRVALVSVEVWNQKDQINVTTNPAETLYHFLSWREKNLLPRVTNDNAQLLTGITFMNSSVGMATMNSMCSAVYSGGVSMDHSVTILGVASTLAHQLGHNLGLSHDTDRKCGQPSKGKKWIMEPSGGFLPGLEFSNCSFTDLEFSLRRGGGMCLFNVPPPKRLFGEPQCGNFLVEEGEQCDCGLSQECTDQCCEATLCQFRGGAECSSGDQCCEGCKLKVSGSMCREPLGVCDLPEYCNGESPHCPPNVYLQNGETCDQGYCYQGECRTIQAQCQDLWGPGSSPAPDPCFSKVNIRGDKYGNCGRSLNGTYLPCAERDVWCGKIQCQGGNSRSRLGPGAQTVLVSVTINGSELSCRGTHFDVGDDIWDSAILVATGTPCGAGKVCVGHKCEDVSKLKVQNCRSKCNGHGVCNSNRNCHCDAGWAPPDCAASGQGGSIDSGSVPLKNVGNSRTSALLMIFLLIVPLLILLSICYWKRNSLQLRLGKLSPSSKCQYRGAQTSDNQSRPQRPPPPMRTQSTELQVMSTYNKGPDRPDPPSKPLPPDPVPNRCQADDQDRPPPPSRPLPADPAPRQVQPPVPRKPPPPKKPLPLDPSSQAPLLSVPAYPDHMISAPSRPAPPPPHSQRAQQV